MKLRYLLSALAGIALLASCKEEPPVASYDLAIELSQSVIAIPTEGGSKTVEVNSGDVTWNATSDTKWITFTPDTGKGKTNVTVTVGESLDDRTGEIVIAAEGVEKYITVIQTGDPHGLAEDDPLTCAEAVELCGKLADKATTGKKYYVKGIISNIVEEFGTQYGNATFWMGDKEGEKTFEAYRVYYFDNAKYDDPAKQNISVGDNVVIYGILMNYGGQAETSQNAAYLYKLDANTDPTLSAKATEITVPFNATSAKFEVSGKNLSGNWTVSTDADWITDYTKSGKDTGEVEVKFAANEVKEPRTATFTVKADGAKDLVLTLTQEAFTDITDATAAEINAKEDGSALFRLKGVVTEIVMDKNDATKYNVYGNFYISDETGSVYVYGLLPEAGGAAKQDVLTAKGVKVGDVITVVGPKGSHKDSPQMVNAYYESHVSVTAKTATEFNALEDGSDLFLIKGKVKDIVMDKNDPTKYNKYGNFYVEDETGSVYVYGIVPISTGKSGQDILTTRGVKAGDIVTVVGPKGSYKGSPQMVNGYLAAVEPGADAAGITIDGEFSDWADVATGVTSAAEVPVYAEFKAASDGTNLYFYAKRDNRAAIWAGGGYFYFDVDADNNSETGTEKDGVPGLESWFYIKPFAGTADAHAIATEFKGEGMEGTVISNIKFAGLDGESYVEFEASIPIADMNVTKGSTIKIYSWGNKDGYDVQKMPVTLTIE